MQQWDRILQQLADNSDEFERQAGTVLLMRQGREVLLTLREVPSIGLAVEEEDGANRWIPIAQYIQQRILDLPRLAKQIVRVLDRLAKRRPAPFVEGPAEYLGSSGSERWAEAKRKLTDLLQTPEAGTTQLIQLMGSAGQGKTILLEEVARDAALGYQPVQFPTPLVLPIDLLGRYVGTVDDAIAGSLNNTYLFTGLTQRDVALCIRQRWLVLALDGFDELVARVGARDAFLRITELLDQLDGSGTVLLSARESFFELYQITAAIRSYLQPKSGSYASCVVRLLPWTEEQGEQVFRALGSGDAKTDLESMLSAFPEDRQIVLQPFFLTRLADLWKKGERFLGVDKKKGTLYRTRFIIEKFIARESEEKWTDREGRPLLSESDHTVLLSGIAEEMWRSGAFRLSFEELRIAGQIAAQGLKLTSTQTEDVIERLPTHAALASKDRGYAFVHDRFLHYYLGVRLARAVDSQAKDAVVAILRARSLTPDIARWVESLLLERNRSAEGPVKFLLEQARQEGDQSLRENVALLLGRLLVHTKTAQVEESLDFAGDVFSSDGLYDGHRFVGCQFWHLDLRKVRFVDVEFLRCRFGDVLVDNDTSLAGCKFDDCEIASIEVEGGGACYAPDDINSALKERGAIVRDPEEPKTVRPWLNISQNAVQCVHKLLRMSERTCDVAIEELAAQFPLEAPQIRKIGAEVGVLKDVNKATSGPRKVFVRVKVDRDLLARGAREQTGDAAVDAFWQKVSKRLS